MHSGTKWNKAAHAHVHSHHMAVQQKSKKCVRFFYVHLYCFMRCALFVSSFPFNCFFISSVSLLLFHPFVSGFLCFSVSISISITQWIFHMCFLFASTSTSIRIIRFPILCAMYTSNVLKHVTTIRIWMQPRPRIFSEKITKEKREA